MFVGRCLLPPSVALPRSLGAKKGDAGETWLLNRNPILGPLPAGFLLRRAAGAGDSAPVDAAACGRGARTRGQAGEGGGTPLPLCYFGSTKFCYFFYLDVQPALNVAGRSVRCGGNLWVTLRRLPPGSRVVGLSDALSEALLGGFLLRVSSRRCVCRLADERSTMRTCAIET